MLYLQSRVHFHEKELPGVWFIEKLYRSGISIFRGMAETNCGVAQSFILLRGERRRGSFFEHFLMAALNGAIADARRPRGAVIVGDDLHLDMARTLDEVLEKNSGIAEGFECFGAGTFEGVRQLVCRVHEANPVTAPACCRLDEQRKTDTVGLGSGICQGFHRPTAPGSDCDLGVLRKTFGSDLVAELAHHVAGRSDENDSHLTAEIGERGVFCHEAPANPDSIGTRRRKRLFESPVVEVAALKMMRLRIGKLG